MGGLAADPIKTDLIASLTREEQAGRSDGRRKYLRRHADDDLHGRESLSTGVVQDRGSVLALPPGRKGARGHRPQARLPPGAPFVCPGFTQARVGAHRARGDITWLTAPTESIENDSVADLGKVRVCASAIAGGTII